MVEAAVEPDASGEDNMANHTATVAGVEVSTDHWIDGRRVPSADRFEDLSPVDGAHLASIAAGGKAEADLAVDAARRAFPAWAALGPEGRLPYLKRFAEGIRARAKDLARRRISSSSRTGRSRCRATRSTRPRWSTTSRMIRRASRR